jgi:hypothetical protein
MHISLASINQTNVKLRRKKDVHTSLQHTKCTINDSTFDETYKTNPISIFDL